MVGCSDRPHRVSSLISVLHRNALAEDDLAVRELLESLILRETESCAFASALATAKTRSVKSFETEVRITQLQAVNLDRATPRWIKCERSGRGNGQAPRICDW